jgi:CRISPR-associated endonuclease/helicase Cas3
MGRSVVLLDECQTLPPSLVAPTCSMLGQLASRVGSTIVLCTATQPAFDHADMPEKLVGVREIIPPSLHLFERLRRVRVAWPPQGEKLDWETVAKLMRKEIAALCIVNTRRAARELFQILRQDIEVNAFHLSTTMCPAHRLAVIATVKKKLRRKERCYLVSTQLIEAGVDIDFSFVLRELAPLEAIIQSAGRCNREGKQNGPDGSPGGRVLVFRSVKGSLPPDRWYKAGRSVVETSFLNAGREPRIEEPADIREYFERLYRTGELDKERIQGDRQACNFPEVARKYRLIDNDGVAVVVATWQEKIAEVESLLEKIRRQPSRATYRRLGPFQVNLRTYELGEAGSSVIEEVPGVLVWRGGYDPHLGLTAENVDVLLLV